MKRMTIFVLCCAIIVSLVTSSSALYTQHESLISGDIVSEVVVAPEPTVAPTAEPTPGPTSNPGSGGGAGIYVINRLHINHSSYITGDVFVENGPSEFMYLNDKVWIDGTLTTQGKIIVSGGSKDVATTIDTNTKVDISREQYNGSHIPTDVSQWQYDQNSDIASFTEDGVINRNMAGQWFTLSKHEKVVIDTTGGDVYLYANYVELDGVLEIVGDGKVTIIGNSYVAIGNGKVNVGGNVNQLDIFSYYGNLNPHNNQSKIEAEIWANIYLNTSAQWPPTVYIRQQDFSDLKLKGSLIMPNCNIQIDWSSLELDGKLICNNLTMNDGIIK